MPFVGTWDKVPCFSIKNRLGKPNGFGWIRPGWSEFGDNNEYAGVYQGRRRRRGTFIGEPVIFQEKDNFFMKPTWPIDPATSAQLTQRAKMTTAVGMWQALTISEKKAYNEIAVRRSRNGYHLFLAQTLKSL